MSLAASDGGWGPLPWAPTLQAGSRPGKAPRGCRAPWLGADQPLGVGTAFLWDPHLLAHRQRQRELSSSHGAAGGAWMQAVALPPICPRAAPCGWRPRLGAFTCLSSSQAWERVPVTLSSQANMTVQDGDGGRRLVCTHLRLGAAIAVSAGFRTHCGRPGLRRHSHRRWLHHGPRLAPAWTLQWCRPCVLSWPPDRRRPG